VACGFCDAGAVSDPAATPGACPLCEAALPERPALTGADRLLGLPGSFGVWICGACGTGSTAPRLEADDLADLYPPGYGSHDSPRGGPLGAAVSVLKRAQVAIVLRGPPFSVAAGAAAGHALDVGCGRGDLAAGLIARGWRVDGVEPSDRAAAAAQGRGVNIVGPTVARASLAAGGYSLIVMRHSLEHVLDPVGDLRRLRDALVPSGQLVISLPNFASWQRRCFGTRWFHLDLPRHRVHFTPASLRLALERAGLEARSQLTSTSVLGLPATVQYALVGRCLAPSGLRLRALAAICCAIFPLTWLADWIGRERDTLHAVATRR
jgi:SAM-dependent methyltransferase